MTETWTATQSALDLRGQGELQVGWWHSHSFLKETCANCEKHKNGTCQADAAFFSVEDGHLHRTVFPKAYSVGLVVADSPCAGLTFSLYGWREGMIAPRGYYVFNGLQPVNRDDGVGIHRIETGG